MCINVQLRDEELSKESQESNWFSAPSALRVYGKKNKQKNIIPFE